MDENLGDLSDDDSFFESKKPIIRRGSSPKTIEKKSVTDLFNLTESKSDKSVTKNLSESRSDKSVTRNFDDWLGLDSKEHENKTPKLQKKISFEENDIFGSAGLESKTVDRSGPSSLENKSKRNDILESILGPSKTEEKKLSFGDILKESKARTNIEDKRNTTFDSIFKDSKSSKLDEHVREVPRDGGRRGRRPSTGLLDPLGLFSNDNKTVDEPDNEPTKTIKTKSASHIPESAATPNWLSDSSSKPSKSESALTTKPTNKEIKEPMSKPKEEEVPAVRAQSPHINLDENSLNPLLAQQKMTHINMEYHNNALVLQQQESQVLLSLQLKKYEDKLAEMQAQQQEVLRKQEQYMNNLLERQMAKQQIIENNLKLQQERINNHIEMLLSQKPSEMPNFELSKLQMVGTSDEADSGNREVHILKQNQENEFHMLEESYKKQITLLEESLDNVENRLKLDLDKVTKNFEEKIESLLKDQETEINRYKEKLQDMENQHELEIKSIRENHNRVVDEIKYEYNLLIENIKENKQKESKLLNESDSYFKKIDDNISVLLNNSSTLQELKNNIDNNYGILSQAREESLKSREKEVVLMREALEKCRAKAEEERSQLMNLVRTLELKIADMNQNSREEKWALQQAIATLTAKSAAMDREIEFNRSSIDRERQQLETMKQSMLAEQEKLTMELTEQKLALAAEKTRLEMSNKLAPNYDAQKFQVETEAAVQAAKEAMEKADKERDRLQQQLNETEKLKRHLLEKERQLNLKEADLEKLNNEAQLKLQQGDRALFESKSIETRYNLRLKELQSQMALISAKEKKVAEEKIALSKERLALYSLLRQKRKCGLCEVDKKMDELNGDSFPYIDNIQEINMDVSRLKNDDFDDISKIP